MRDWKSLLGVMLIFLLGCLAGAFVALAVVHHRTTVFLQRGSLAYEQFLERRLSHRLHLDPNQRERFHEAFMANIDERKQIQAQVQPQMKALNAQTGQQIRAILTPEQLEQFHENLADFRHRFGTPGMGSGQAVNTPASPTTTTNGAPTEIGTNPPSGQL
jgi:hypothetical protein